MRRSLRVYSDRRVLTLTLLGFSSGLPLALTGGTLAAWMTNSGISLTTIGLFALVGLPYNAKVLWAPLLDRYQLPWLDRRRGWILLTQGVLVVLLLLMAQSDPASATASLAGIALAVSISSASQDIVVDAYRTDVLPKQDRAAGTATSVLGYRLAQLTSGALALVLSQYLEWPLVYRLMALLMAICMLVTINAPRLPAQTRPKTLGEAYVHSVTDYFAKPKALTALAFVLLYKFGDAVAGTMSTPFLIRVGFSNAEIGVLSKGLGLSAALVGALAGGALVTSFGLRRSLLVFGLLQALTNGFYVALAILGPVRGLLALSIATDQLFGGMATTAYVALLIALCTPRFSATQFALLSSASSLGGRLFAAFSGVLASTLGWPVFFVLTIVLGLPALVLLFHLPGEYFGDAQSEATSDSDNH